MIITSAAHLALCKCRKHGKVVAANGEESPELCSKEAARNALNLFFARKLVLPCEKDEALRQINTSALAETDEDATILDHLKTEAFNMVHEIMLEEARSACGNNHWVN